MIKNIDGKMSVTVKIILGIIIFGAIITLSFFAGKNYNNKIIKKIENHETGYSYISPLLECENNLPLNYNYVKLKNNLQKMINNRISDHKVQSVSLYFRDLNNGPWIGINEQDQFSPASLLKVPLMMSYLKLAENNPETLKTKLTVEEYEENVQQNIIPAKKVNIGEQYTVEDLINYMIYYSDNSAANTLLANIPPEKLNSIYTDFNLEIPGIEKTENYMTVTNYASFFRILYNASFLSREMSEKALKILTSSSFSDGLTAKIPPTVEVAHKFGERIVDNKKQLHDCGIIYLKNNNYLLCIMTRGEDFKKMEETIADISGNVFTNIVSFTK